MSKRGPQYSPNWTSAYLLKSFLHIACAMCIALSSFIMSHFLLPPTWVASSMVERDKLIYP
jgi:hypothetical protein